MATPFDISDEYVTSVTRLEPLTATRLGVPGADHLWGDHGIEGYEARVDLDRAVKRRLEEAARGAEGDQLFAAAVLTRMLDRQIDRYERGEHLRDLRHMASTFQHLVRVFDLMDATTRSGWDAIVQRLETIDRALEGYCARLRRGLTLGFAVPARQVRSVMDQAASIAGTDSSLMTLGRRAAESGVAEATRVDRAVTSARSAIGSFHDFLEQEYLPRASDQDAVGADRYRWLAAGFLGMDIEPLEAYGWGWDEFGALVSEIEAVAATIEGGGDLDSVTRLLDTDPGRLAATQEEFRTFIAARQQKALEELSGVHFDVDSRIRNVTVNLAPSGTPLGAYYIGPSEDFSRPGGIWYSLGSQNQIPLFHHVSTAYHEGFPGHHLQIGTAMANHDRISRAHRLMVWYPGYSEGWALYAERLMGDFGYLERPDYVFGMLAKHLYRAVRVVVDIGLHLGLQIPTSAPIGPGETWTPGAARAYLEKFGFRTPDQATAEVLRYLGWPGQAISYKMGEREILRVRRDAERSLPEFDLKKFHRAVLGRGSLPLDMLASAVHSEWTA